MCSIRQCVGERENKNEKEDVKIYNGKSYFLISIIAYSCYKFMNNLLTFKEYFMNNSLFAAVYLQFL